MHSIRLHALVLVLGLHLTLPGLAHATQIQLPVDQASSTLRLELCADPGLGQQCDAETRPLTGYLRMALDENGAPTQVAMRDFDLRAVGNYNFQLRWAFGLAGVDATASNLRIYHARPGITNPFTPLTASAFSFPAVPFLAEGNAVYDLTGLACSVVSIPCSSNINLANLGENTIQALGGTLQITNGLLIVNLDFTFTTALDPANPTLGTLTGRAIVRASAPINLSMVPPGATWKYHDTGVNLGGAWSLPAGLFDDNAWASGEGQLGYGDGDELTVVGYGPNAAQKHMTTYFRRTFNVEDALDYTNLALRVLADDGVVVYLNGVEVYRKNMPDGEPLFNTPASAAVSGAAENAYFIAAPPPPIHLLANGLNTLAAEVHQSDPASSDLSFDLELAGNAVFTNRPPTVVITSPTNGTAMGEGNLTFQISATDPDGIVTRVVLYEGANPVGEDVTLPYTITRPSLCAGTYSFVARAYDETGAEGVSAPVVVTVARPAVSLISTGAVWRYLDNGTDQGTAWRARTFNDAGWAGGPGQLGFGDGDESTTINGGPSTARYITTYFRHTFQLTNAAAVGSLTLRLLRDDGAVVYLNGVEVHRNNMPAGTILYTTLASTNAGGSDETVNFYTSTVSAAALTNGANVIAVEVHQVNNTSSDLSFNLTLAANYTNLPPAVALVSPTPAPDTTLPLGGGLTLAANASDPDGYVARVEFYLGTNKLAEVSAAPYMVNLGNLPAGYHVFTARAIDGCGAVRSSAPVPVRVGTAVMVPPGTTWRFLDNGSDQGTNWQKTDFDDSAWSTGSAQFGYGEGDEATVINSGPTTSRFITTYFRRPFVVADPQTVTGLVVRLLRDDGAVVYLNGIEILRSNMPTGPVGYLTVAPLAVGGTDETTFFVTELPATLLGAGTNLLAVEIHQQASSSSDVSFDLELIGLTSVGPPRLQMVPAGSNHVLLRWPASATASRLQFGSNPSPAASWQYAPGEPSTDGTWKTLLVPVGPGAQFFRLAP
ncbi:MAG: hypothetical protein RJA22_674 [Verrucomicrobiota bacterium]